MEIDIGKQCKKCNQLDYLPFFCSKCKEYFCVIHRNDHSCLYSKKEKKIKRTIIIDEPCFFSRCKKIKIHTCKLCGKSYCINHRHQEVHFCEKIQDNLEKDKNKLEKDKNKLEKDKSKLGKDNEETFCKCVIC